MLKVWSVDEAIQPFRATKEVKHVRVIVGWARVSQTSLVISVLATYILMSRGASAQPLLLEPAL